MSKKRFSAGLDDLFKDVHVEQANFIGSSSSTVVQTERKMAQKNFMSDLDSLLQEALEESLEKYESNQPDTTTPSSKTKTSSNASFDRPALTGLDALIRQTIDVQEIATDEASGKKRLTVAVDKSKLDKLKVIARLENSYLKDLLVNLIDGYIVEYTQQRGIDL